MAFQRIRFLLVVLIVLLVCAVIMMHSGVLQHHEALKCLVGSHCGDTMTSMKFEAFPLRNM